MLSDRSCGNKLGFDASTDDDRRVHDHQRYQDQRDETMADRYQVDHYMKDCCQENHCQVDHAFGTPEKKAHLNGRVE